MRAPDSTGPVFGSSSGAAAFDFTALASKEGEGIKTAQEGFRSGTNSSLESNV